jgi:hypothetical protein
MPKENIVLTEKEKDIAIRALNLLQQETAKVGVKADDLGAKESKTGATKYLGEIDALKTKFL